MKETFNVISVRGGSMENKDTDGIINWGQVFILGDKINDAQMTGADVYKVRITDPMRSGSVPSWTENVKNRLLESKDLITPIAFTTGTSKTAKGEMVKVITGLAV